MRTCTVCMVQAMSMRGSGSEESITETAGNLEEQPSQSVISLEMPSLNRSTPVHPTSPLTALLLCRDVAPRIMEHEKALLVMKEHDYAKAPDKPELLQLASLLVNEGEKYVKLTSNETVGPQSEPLNLNRKAMKDMLLNCRSDVLGLRENLVRREENDVVYGHLREIISLQVALIQEQQEQLHGRDKELNTVRKEKEQLEARLERMERRLAILQKHSRDRNAGTETEPQAPSSSISSTPRTRPSRAEQIASSESHVRSRSSSVDAGRTRSRPTSHGGTPIPQDERETNSAKKPVKRRIKTELENGSLRKTKKRALQPSIVRTTLEYSGLDLPIPIETAANCIDDDICSNHDLECKDDGNEIGEITVPPWHVNVIRSSSSGGISDCCEDTSDDMFVKRHRKPEEDEKRRKRWDMQRSRALREHEELLRKYLLKEKSQGQGKEKKKEKEVTSFMPRFDEVEEIEVNSSIVVSAFGRPLPLMKASEFQLPWFDLDAREAKENVRTTRSKAKAARLSVGSSDES